jgi:PleD family two-component response regulator
MIIIECVEQSGLIGSTNGKVNNMARHILVVDDDMLMRRSLSSQLEQAGYRTSTAVSAEDALSLHVRSSRSYFVGYWVAGYGWPGGFEAFPS